MRRHWRFLVTELIVRHLPPVHHSVVADGVRLSPSEHGVVVVMVMVPSLSWPSWGIKSVHRRVPIGYYHHSSSSAAASSYDCDLNDLTGMVPPVVVHWVRNSVHRPRRLLFEDRPYRER